LSLPIWLRRYRRAKIQQANETEDKYTARFVYWDYIEIANTNQGHVGKKPFENVITEFAPKFENLKPLARELRSALFPIRDGDIFTGTFQDHGIMYDGKIKAFDRAITSLRKEEQANV
jgi:hypothetical protein